MGRELKRVPVDFEWPLNQIWKGYHNPFEPLPCKHCQRNPDDPFADKSNTDGFSDAFRELTERVRELRRSQRGFRDIDLEALREEGLLEEHIEDGPFPEDPTVRDLERHLDYHALPGSPSVRFTPKMFLAIREARAKEQGIWEDRFCDACGGDGEFWFSEEIKERAENWYDEERYDPPEGEGWQVWETVSEGAPVTPVFETAEALIEHLTEEGTCWDRPPWSRDAAEHFVRDSGWSPSGMIGPSTDGIEPGHEACAKANQ